MDLGLWQKGRHFKKNKLISLLLVPNVNFNYNKLNRAMVGILYVELYIEPFHLS